MSYTTAILLALIEGLTEFIPVSSTGHMILLSAALGEENATTKTFEIFIQLGAIIAVICLYPRRFRDLFAASGAEEAIDRSAMRGRAGLVRFGAACLPAFVLGFLFHRPIKTYLFSPLTVAIGLILGGVAFIWLEKTRAAQARGPLESISVRTAFAIGLFQCISLWPGFSRSGSTILGGMLLGLSRTAAAEFSFLISVPVMFAAVLYDLSKSASHLSIADVPVFGLGFFVAFVTAAAAIRFFIGLLSHWTLVPFGVYRILLGAAVLASLA